MTYKTNNNNNNNNNNLFRDFKKSYFLKHCNARNENDEFIVAKNNFMAKLENYENGAQYIYHHHNLASRNEDH